MKKNTTTTTTTRTPRLPSSSHPEGDLRTRARDLGLWGLLAHWDEVEDQPWLEILLQHEEGERHQRSLERRLTNARLGRFTPIADFDWTWPKKIDRELVLELLQLGFVAECANVVLVGPSGIGKTTIGKNIVYQAVLAGRTALWTTASEMLSDLVQHEGMALARRVRRYTRPTVLGIDEIGYLSYGRQHADLLFDVLSRRHLDRPTLVTTNRPFSEWNEVFPQSSCVVALVDRLVNRCEIVAIDGPSHRHKEAQERAKRKQAERAARSRSKQSREAGQDRRSNSREEVPPS